LEEKTLFSLAIKAIERLSTRGEKKRKATNGREQKFTELNGEKTGEAYRGDRERITQKKEQRNREGEKKQRNDIETRISPTIVFVPSSQN
jgi:hypothetical protein